MTTLNKIITAIAAIPTISFSSCRPKELDIKVDQGAPLIAISNTLIGESTLIVTATYSLSSLVNLGNQTNDTNTNSLNALAALLVTNGTVIISSNDGYKDTLSQLSPGLFVLRNAQLQANKQYHLYVKDNAKNISVTATTTFVPQFEIEKMQPKVVKNAQDTIVNIELEYKDNDAAINYYMLAYDWIDSNRSMRDSVNLPSVFGIEGEGKQLILFADESNSTGTVKKLLRTDLFTGKGYLLVHAAKIDKSYYEFLKAYSRVGNIFNQLTSEPISLPTNIQSGVGYFALYRPIRNFYDLSQF